MAISIADVANVKNQPQRFGQLNARIVDITMDSAYAAGGEEITEAAVGFTTIYGGICLGFTNGATDDKVTWATLDVETSATPKVVCMDGNGEVSGSTDLSGVTLRFMLLGK